MQLSRYERIEEEGESRSGNYEKESERAREGEPSHSCWFMARATAAACYIPYPGPVNASLKDHILNTETGKAGDDKHSYFLSIIAFQTLRCVNIILRL